MNPFCFLITNNDVLPVFIYKNYCYTTYYSCKTLIVNKNLMPCIIIFMLLD